MGKSAKAKKEKKKDFQKPKLKVGKTKAKADNFTDTSFKARSINVLQQNLTTSAPSTIAQFSHHLSLLGHKSDGQKQQSLGHLVSVLQTCQAQNIALPQPASVILAKTQPLMRDSNAQVRASVLRLMKCLPTEDVLGHTEGLLLWIRLGMTNLSGPIRMSALDVLEWLLEIAGQEVVGCSGGWSKTLKCFAGILGWDAPVSAASKDGKWTSTPSTGSKGTSDSKLVLRTLTVLTAFLQNGLLPREQEDTTTEAAKDAALVFPLWQTKQHVLPIQMGASNPFGYLDLFGAPKDEDGAAYEGFEERSEYFEEKWRASFENGAKRVLQDGGGVGRAAVSLMKVMKSAREIAEQESD